MTKRNTIIPASYLVLIKNNKILLLRRYNTGYEDWNYSMVAGHVDKGEGFMDCMIREAKEEAWIEIKRSDLEMVHTMSRNAWDDFNSNERIDIFFKAKKWQWDLINMEPDKCDDLSWFDLDNLPENIIPCIKQAIEHIKKSSFYSESGWK